MLVLLLALSGSAQADQLYCVPGGNTLAVVDTNALTITNIGPVGFSGIGGLATSSQYVLYGLTDSEQLIEIDPLTGAGSLIGNTGGSVTYSTGLAVHPFTNVIYGVATHGVGSSSFLVTFDNVTGAMADVGDTFATAIVGMDFDAGGQLYAIDGSVNEWILIDHTTGTRTVPNPLSLAAWPSIGGLEIGVSGTVWAIHMGVNAYELVSIDPVTGTATYEGDLIGVGVAGNVTGLASADPVGPIDADQDGFTVDDGDCDDFDPDTYPGAPELCDGVDNDCDGAVPATETDGDGDGWMDCEDCDDTDPTVRPDGVEMCDGLDNDCDGLIDPGEVDDDLDGFAECQGDCDDLEAAMGPGFAELCDGLDNDCDGTVPADEVDADADGVLQCEDCNDSDAGVFPGNIEVPGDGIDQDCDGVDATVGTTGSGPDTGAAADPKTSGCSCATRVGSQTPVMWAMLLLFVARRSH